MPAEEDYASIALVREIQEAHLQILEDDAFLPDALYRPVQVVRLDAVFGPYFAAAVGGRGPKDGLHVRGFFAQLIAVASHVQKEFLELRQEGVRLFHGEEPRERMLHAGEPRLPTVGQAVGEHAWEAGGPDLGLRLLHVVVHEAVKDSRAAFFGMLGEHV